MEKISFRSAVALGDGRFDCEIEHPLFGWIPFTADPNDVAPHGRQIAEAIAASLKGGQIRPTPAPPPRTTEPSE